MYSTKYLDSEHIKNSYKSIRKKETHIAGFLKTASMWYIHSGIPLSHKKE